MLPESINILGLDYTIKEAGYIERGEELCGKIDYIGQKTLIERGITQQRKEQTLLHEVVHGIGSPPRVWGIQTQIYLSVCPSLKAIQDAIMIDRLEFDFKFGKLEEEFICWECDHHVHWLDIKGDLKTKITCLKEKYCGC
jgi:hypothetical protein